MACEWWLAVGGRWLLWTRAVADGVQRSQCHVNGVFICLGRLLCVDTDWGILRWSLERAALSIRTA